MYLAGPASAPTQLLTRNSTTVAVHAQGTDPWAAGQGAWPSLPPLEQAQSSASAGREASGDIGEQKSGRRQQQQQGFDHEQLQSPRNGGGSDGAPKSARQRRLEINRRSQTLYRERQKVRSTRHVLRRAHICAFKRPTAVLSSSCGSC